jgi:hypothetical protein
MEKIEDLVGNKAFFNWQENDMTIRMPKEGLPDKILKALGKKRGAKIPAGIFKKFDPQKVDVYATAQKESFWKALLRSKNEELPDEFFNLYDFEE